MIGAVVFLVLAIIAFLIITKLVKDREKKDAALTQVEIVENNEEVASNTPEINVQEILAAYESQKSAKSKVSILDYLKVILWTIGLAVIPTVAMILVPRWTVYVDELHKKADSYNGDTVFTQILNEAAKTDANVTSVYWNLKSYITSLHQELYNVIIVGIVSMTVVLGILIIAYHHKKQ